MNDPHRTRLWETPHFVYTIRDSDGLPMYVGMTCNLDRRLREHSHRQVWWGNVASVESTRVRGSHAARLAEGALIRQLRPRRNTAGVLVGASP